MPDLVETLRFGGLTLVAFPPSAFSLYIHPHASRPGRTLPARAADALASDPAVLAALDGPMFSLCDGGEYATATCADLDYLHYDPARGVDDPGENRGRGVTIGAGTDGQAVWLPGGNVPPGTRAAVQLYPTLVRDGRAVASNTGPNASRVWRAGLVVLGDGRLAFAAMVSDMEGFARALVDAGAREAGYTDGGGSTRLATLEGHVGSGENRRVASFLVARTPPASAVPAVAVGGSVALVGVGVASAAGLAYALWRVWRRTTASGYRGRA